MDLDELLRLLRSFEEQGVDYVLIGATALNLHGIIRATEDVDVFVRPTAENVDRVRRALHAIYDDTNIDQIGAEDLLGDYPAVRYHPPSGTLFLDILTRLGEFATYDDLEAQDVEVEGVRVRVATPRTLYWLKKEAHPVFPGAHFAPHTKNPRHPGESRGPEPPGPGFRLSPE